MPELSRAHNQYLTLLARILVADDTLLEEAVLAFKRKTGLQPAEERLRDWLLARADAVVNAHPSKIGGLVDSVVGRQRQLIESPTADVSLSPRTAAERLVLHAVRQGRLLAAEEKVKGACKAAFVEPAPKLAQRPTLVVERDLHPPHTPTRHLWALARRVPSSTLKASSCGRGVIASAHPAARIPRSRRPKRLLLPLLLAW